MSTYGAESFYRATIRQSIDATQAVPFTLKVSKIPTLTTGLLTVSPNTANEEILEYSGVDGTALTLTVVKRGISPSTQALLVNGTDYNNVTYQKSHSQNDSIRCDVTHLHIIQDYGTLQANKLDKAAGLRTSFPASSTVELNLTTGVEEVNTVSQVTTPTSGDIVRLKKSDLNYEEISLANFQAALSPSTLQETNYESIIALGDYVGQTPDGIYKMQTSNKTSTAIGGSNTYFDHIQISTGVYMVLYYVGTSLNAVIMTLSSADAATYGTPFTITTGTGLNAKIAYIDTNKVVCVYCVTSSTTMSSVILSVSGTTISAGTVLNEGKTASAGLLSVCKMRTTAYVYTTNNAANTGYLQTNSISGTTCSSGTQIATSFQGASIYAIYLSDNYIATWNNGDSAGNLTYYIYKYNTGATTVLTTYTGGSLTTDTAYVSRYSDTEFIMTRSSTATKRIYSIPGAGTALSITTLTAPIAANYPTISLFNGIYGIHNGSQIDIYQRDILLGTITGVPAMNSSVSPLWYSNGRLVILTGATLIPNIINISGAFKIGVALGATGTISVGNTITAITGILRGYQYYVQVDGSVSNTLGITNTAIQTSKFGRGVLQDKFMITY